VKVSLKATHPERSTEGEENCHKKLTKNNKTELEITSDKQNECLIFSNVLSTVKKMDRLFRQQ
jgi:hypothetical protein